MNTKGQLASPKALPLSYFWAIEYFDGTTISQFHPSTGQEIPWSRVHSKNKKIRRAFWFPFTETFAKKVLAASGQICLVLPSQAKLEVELPPGAPLILKRKGFLKLGFSAGLSPLTQRAYVLGFIFNGETHVMARDAVGKPIDAERVAGWVRGLSVADEVGAIEEKN